MKAAGWRKTWQVILSIALVCLLAGLLKDTIQRWVAPVVLYSIWLLRLAYRALPQAILWIVFLAVIYSIAAKSLSIHPLTSSKQPPIFSEKTERYVAKLTRWMEKSQRNYYRYRLVNSLAELAIAVIAQKQHISPQQARLALKAGTCDLPPEIIDFLREGLSALPISKVLPFDFLASLINQAPPTQSLQAEVKMVLYYLEEQMEVKHEL